MGNEIANSRDAINPAVVPPITRTIAKTAMHVNEPSTNGNIIVKSYNDEFPPNMLYKVAAMICKETCDVMETSLPYGCQDLSSFQL